MSSDLLKSIADGSYFTDGGTHPGPWSGIKSFKDKKTAPQRPVSKRVPSSPVRKAAPATVAAKQTAGVAATSPDELRDMITDAVQKASRLPVKKIAIRDPETDLIRYTIELPATAHDVKEAGL